MKTQPTNMQRDILALNMEQQLSDLASDKYGKSLSACSNKEL